MLNLAIHKLTSTESFKDDILISIIQSQLEKRKNKLKRKDNAFVMVYVLIYLNLKISEKILSLSLPRSGVCYLLACRFIVLNKFEIKNIPGNTWDPRLLKREHNCIFHCDSLLLHLLKGEKRPSIQQKRFNLYGCVSE